MLPPAARAATVAALLLPALAGCTGPVQGPGVDPSVVQSAFVVQALNLSVDSPYGHVRAEGRALAVPVKSGSEEAGVVYLAKPQMRWRADAIFDVKQASGAADLFVQPPPGELAQLRQRQGWAPATAEDMASFGYPQEGDAWRRASALLPLNRTPPEAGSWTVNSTLVFATFRPHELSLASETGPFFFKRNASAFFVIDGGALIQYDVVNRTLQASQDALASAEVRDPSLADIDIAWGAGRLEVKVKVPSFREADLQVQDERSARIVSVEFPGRVAKVAMVGYQERTIDDDRVELRSKNITLCAGTMCR